MFGKKKEDMKVIGCTLIEGLPVIKGSDLILKLTGDGVSIIVTPTKQTFEISFSKLTSVQYYNETEMEKVISQSAPGMIIGGAAFGILGAMVGGRIKTKEKKTVTHFVVIDFESEGSKQIVVQSNDFFGAGQIADLFRKLKPIELAAIAL
ncbi:MAG: hypothetical protein PHR06_01280 [Candidatus Cloacimonetes bacterium]|nr:hypothetical protein [Candidatus Cloacimonadota bacterium]